MDTHHGQLGKLLPQTESPFFQLPRELRDIIYHYALQNASVSTRWNLHSGNYPPKPMKLPSGILLACKLAHDETIELYYIATTFHFGGFHHAITTLRSIPKPYTELIQKVNIWVTRMKLYHNYDRNFYPMERINRDYASKLKKGLEGAGILLNSDVKVVEDENRR